MSRASTRYYYNIETSCGQRPWRICGPACSILARPNLARLDQIRGVLEGSVRDRIRADSNNAVLGSAKFARSWARPSLSWVQPDLELVRPNVVPILGSPHPAKLGSVPPNLSLYQYSDRMVPMDHKHMANTVAAQCQHRTTSVPTRCQFNASTMPVPDQCNT